MPPKKSQTSTSWDSVGKWYHSSVGSEGHYYHRQIILPGVLRLFQLKKNSSVLDLACGQGVLARQLPPNIPYVGVDDATSLIKEAKKSDSNPNHQYIVADITKPLSLDKYAFSHASVILALQNVEQPESVLQIAYDHLQQDGILII